MAEFNSRQAFGYNKFNRSHRHFTSLNLGYAYPIRVSEVVPGQTLSENIDCFVRMLPFVNPAFADIDLEISHYYVSWNAIDPHYSVRTAQFQGDKKNPELFTLRRQVNAPLVTNFFSAGMLPDYMGCNAGESFVVPSDVEFKLSLGPFLAYHMIIDRYFRNPHLSDVEATRKFIRDVFPDWRVAVVDGTQEAFYDVWHKYHTDGDPSQFWRPQLVNWAPDYFTTSRPTANGSQLVIPGLDIPTLTEAFNKASQIPSVGAAVVAEKATIPALWDAELMQKVISMLEHGGYSYFDYMKVLYGVDLNQSEYEDEYPVYLGGSSRPLSVDTVYQQSPNATSESGSGLGNQAGQGTAYNSNNGFSRRFSKAGFVISIAVLRPQVAYLSGVAPMFRRFKLGDQLIPALADLSDQPIMKSELNGSDIINSNVFGYTDRYNEYRTQFNRASGTLRNVNSDWIMSRRYKDGTISEDWVKARASYEPFQITDEAVPHFFARCHVQEEVTLPLPYKPRPYVW